MAKAMILAAGQGTRVRPLTKYMPKPMIPILGKPVLEYLIEHLARYGVKEIMINVAYSHWKIESYFGNGHRWGVEIGYSFEGKREHGEIVPNPKGAAGGMRKSQIRESCLSASARISASSLRNACRPLTISSRASSASEPTGRPARRRWSRSLSRAR